MRHQLNGQRASDWDQKESITVIAVIALNGMFPPLDLEPGQPMVRPLQQITLRPDQVTEEGYLRLGNTPGDEAHCWIHPQNIQIVEVLGTAVKKEQHQPGSGVVETVWECRIEPKPKVELEEAA